MNISTQYLKSVQSLFEQYKSLGEKGNDTGDRRPIECVY